MTPRELKTHSTDANLLGVSHTGLEVRSAFGATFKLGSGVCGAGLELVEPLGEWHHRIVVRKTEVTSIGALVVLYHCTFVSVII